MRPQFLPGESVADYDRRRVALSRAEYAEKAAALIEERGWHQGDYDDKATGAICAEGALNYVVGGAVDYDGSAFDLIAALRHRLGDCPVSRWNDEVCERPEQVVGELRKWAADLRGEAAP